MYKKPKKWKNEKLFRGDGTGICPYFPATEATMLGACPSRAQKGLFRALYIGPRYLFLALWVGPVILRYRHQKLPAAVSSLMKAPYHCQLS